VERGKQHIPAVTVVFGLDVNGPLMSTKEVLELELALRIHFLEVQNVPAKKDAASMPPRVVSLEV
jgi:hypothetical protein